LLEAVDRPARGLAGRGEFAPRGVPGAPLCGEFGGVRVRALSPPLHMAAFVRSCCVVFLALAALPASAESLRCNGQSVSEGDSRLSVFYKCGEPLLKDAFCAPIYAQGALRPVPEPFASLLFPCVQVEEWLYDRGPGNLLATVRFQSGAVQSITYGRSPR
jgi:hypothetical protein